MARRRFRVYGLTLFFPLLWSDACDPFHISHLSLSISFGPANYYPYLVFALGFSKLEGKQLKVFRNNI